MTVVGSDLPHPAAGAAAWRRPPLVVPAWRRPSSTRGFAMLGVLFLFYVYSVAGGTLTSVPGVPLPATLPYLVICAVGVGYGLAVIATAARPRVRLLMRDWGLGGSPAARVWFGLACMLPLAASVVSGWVLRAAGPFSTLATTPLSWLVGLLGPAVFVICLVLARVCSLRPVKRAILGGRAPSFEISADLASWWDGEAWASIFVCAPESALRSPDGNYWWAGEGWLPLPPRPRHA